MGFLKSLFKPLIVKDEQPLHCPRDKTVLVQEDMFDIALYCCPQCDGRWLPNTQAPKFFKRMADPEKAVREFLDRVDNHSQASGACCAADGAAMRYFTQRGVTLDVCTTCRGIWFDGDELGQLMASAPEATTGSAATDPAAATPAKNNSLTTADAVGTAAVAVGAVEVASVLFDLFS